MRAEGSNPAGPESSDVGVAPLWDALHRQSRFRPRYPNEHVVRFLRSLQVESSSGGLPVSAVDIGCGGGRHTVLLADLGFAVAGTDISSESLEFTRAALVGAGHQARLVVAPMTELPFEDATFEVAISYGVFYYGTSADGRQAVAELHRVLKPGGRAFVVVRSDRDYRFGKGTMLEPGTFLLDIDETNEQGMTVHFLDEAGVKDAYAGFARMSFELTETTFAARTAKNSDWLITVEK